MNLAEALRIAIGALRINKGRSVLTMLGIIIGVLSVILLVSIGTGLRLYVVEQFEALGSNLLFVIPGELEFAPGGGGGPSMPGAGIAASKFTLDHGGEIAREAETVKFVMPYGEYNATASWAGREHTTIVLAMGSEYPEISGQEAVLGEFFSSSQEESGKRVVILGRKAADELFGEENPVGRRITLADNRFTVIGVMEERGGGFGMFNLDNVYIIPIPTALRVFEADRIQSFWVQSTSPDLIEKTREEVETILLGSLGEDEFSVIDSQNVLDIVSQVLNVMTVALGGIAAISLLVGGIGIMNIMLVSVTERTREIGLRKAVGATPTNILLQFLIEAVVLSLIGGLIGIILGALGSWAIGRFITTSITWWAVALAFLVSSLVGIIFGVAPAFRASRLSPVEALRYE